MQLSQDVLLQLYKTMLTIRRFEERLIYEVGARRSGSVHASIGQEAVAAGICGQLNTTDYVTSTHRGHGHCIAKGLELTAMVAELFGRTTGTNKGKGGSMHITDLNKGMLGASGIVGGNVALAVGAALTAKIKETDQVSVAFFGDGGANQGVVHESMNLASIWKLPVIFLCENNLYAGPTPVEYALSVDNVADRAIAYSMPGVEVDGMDVFAVYEAGEKAVEHARAGMGPSLLECKTYRFLGHAAMDSRNYRLKEEEEFWRRRDPLVLFSDRVLQEGLLTEGAMKQVSTEVDQLIDEAVKFADESPWPELESLYDDVYDDYPREDSARAPSVISHSGTEA